MLPAFVEKPPLENDAAETPVIVEVPHAGLGMDACAMATLAASARSVARDADLYVDELYQDAPRHGATLLCSRTSRYVVDLNRGEADIDDQAVVGAPSGGRAPRGVVWRLTSDGTAALVRPLPRPELIRRLDGVYRPYHRALCKLIDQKRERFGFAVVLAAHSMPSVGRAGHTDTQSARADTVPGTRGRTSSASVFIDAVDAHARRSGLSVAHDTPYRGGFTTQHYGRPSANVHVVQLELARRLYMDEETLERLPERFAWTQNFCAELVRLLGRLRP
jgi:N-formylglutamate deformylase